MAIWWRWYWGLWRLKRCFRCYLWWRYIIKLLLIWIIILWLNKLIILTFTFIRCINIYLIYQAVVLSIFIFIYYHSFSFYLTNIYIHIRIISNRHYTHSPDPFTIHSFMQSWFISFLLFLFLQVLLFILFILIFMHIIITLLFSINIFLLINIIYFLIILNIINLIILLSFQLNFHFFSHFHLQCIHIPLISSPSSDKSSFLSFIYIHHSFLLLFSC